MGKYQRTYAERAAAYKKKQNDKPHSPTAGPALTPEQRKHQATEAWLNSPVAPGSPTTWRDIAKERKTAISAEFAPADQELSAQRALSAGRQQSIDTWYGNYQNELKGLRASEQARSDQVTGQVKSLGEGSAALSAADATRIQNVMNQDAASRGATADPALNAQAIQAARANQSSTAGFGSLMATQGLANDTYAANRLGTTSQAKAEAHVRELANLGKIDANQLDLARQKGLAASKYTTDAVQRERQYGLSIAHQHAEDVATGVKQTAAEEALRVRLLTAGINPDTGKYDPTLKAPKDPKVPNVNVHGYTDEAWASMTTDQRRNIIAADKKSGKTGGSGSKPDPVSGPGSLTKSEEAKRIGRLRKISSYFKTGYPVVDSKGHVVKKIGGRSAGAKGVKELRTYLLTQAGVDPLAVKIAENLYYNRGRLDPQGVKQAHRYGIHVNGNFATYGNYSNTDIPKGKV